MTPNFAHADGPLPLGRVGPRSVSLGQLVRRVQDYTKKWPEPTRYPRNAEVCATDTDHGFERLLRECLEDALLPGQVSGVRDLGMGDGRTPAVVPRHELDLILLCDEGRFVIEAKAWQEEAGKEAVIVFLAKILDFMAAPTFDPFGPIFAGFIALNGFSDAALRIVFACGLTPITRRAEQLSFGYLDALLGAAVDESTKRGWTALEQGLRECRATLTPYVTHEKKGMSGTFVFDSDSIVVDLHGIRHASEMYDEARAAHHKAMTCYRQFMEAVRSG
jgi:hypothetical protein